MLFNSFAFLVFFPTVFILYFSIPHKYRTLLLLVASCVFYMWLVPWYILILFFLIGVDYAMGLLIDRQVDRRQRKRLLWVSIAATCSVLVVFKYYGFLNELSSQFLSVFGLEYAAKGLGLALPIGLSFHTFQSLSYVIEVYKGRQPAEKSLATYAAYVLFFPQLVAGPIERPQNLIHQFKEEHRIDPQRISSGLRLMLWGLFKKVVVADRLALAVNLSFDDPAGRSGLALALAAAFFAIQIYLDFSGYSDIARGSARCLGFDLVVNFRRPFFATSIADFWRRWHISLTAWFKDYVYVPLGGNRGGTLRTHFNTIFTFFLSGLWHGAGIHFVVWGTLNGILISLQRAYEGSGRAARLPASLAFKVPSLLKRLAVFAAISITLIFFRASSLSEAMLVLWRIPRRLGADVAGALGEFFGGGSVSYWLFGSSDIGLGIIPILIVAVFAVEYVQEYPDAMLSRMVRFRFVTSRPFRWSVYYVLIFAILFLGVYERAPFIYFQF